MTGASSRSQGADVPPVSRRSTSTEYVPAPRHSALPASRLPRAVTGRGLSPAPKRAVAKEQAVPCASRTVTRMPSVEVTSVCAGGTAVTGT